MNISEKIKSLDKKVVLIFLAVFLFHLIFQTVFFQTLTEYDHDRDLIIGKEIYERGTISYFGSAYIINPPLNYLMHASLNFLSGEFIYLHHQIFEIVMFFLALVLIYFIMLELTANKKVALYTFLISSLAWSFTFATAIRSYSLTLLFGNLIIFAYIKYLKKPDWKWAVITGIVLGLGMLAKTSLAWLAMIITLHFILNYFLVENNLSIYHFIAIGLIAWLVYSPWLIYLFVNELAMPWKSIDFAYSAQASWLQNFTPPPYWQIHLVQFKYWPYLFIPALVFAVYKLKEIIKSKDYNNPYVFVLGLFFILPLIIRLIQKLLPMNDVNMHQFFYIFTAIPLLALSYESLEKINWEKYSKYLVAVLIILSIIWLPIQLKDRGTSREEYYNANFFEFADKLTKDDVVLSQKYTFFRVFSDASSEYTPEFNPQQALIYSADYYIGEAKIENSALTFIQEVNLPNNQILYAYKIDAKKILPENIILGKMKIVDEKENPVTLAKCGFKSTNLEFMGVSNNNGEINTPFAQIEENLIINCESIGYENFAAQTDIKSLANLNIVMKSKSKFKHENKNTRY